MNEINEQQDKNQVQPENNQNLPVQKAEPVIGWIATSLLMATVIFLTAFSIIFILKNKEPVDSKCIDFDQAKSRSRDNTNPNFKVLSPKDGDTFCLENENEISWTVPADVKTVVLSLNTSTSANRIGEFPAVQSESNGVGYGKIQWNMANEFGYVVKGSDVYFVTMTAFLDGNQLQAQSDGIFAVKNCSGSSASTGQNMEEPKMVDDRIIIAYLVSDIATAQNPINAGKSIERLVDLAKIACSGDAIINASPNQTQRAIFRRSCEHPAVYFCLDMSSRQPYDSDLKQVDKAYVDSGAFTCEK